MCRTGRDGPSAPAPLLALLGRLTVLAFAWVFLLSGVAGAIWAAAAEGSAWERAGAALFSLGEGAVGGLKILAELQLAQERAGHAGAALGRAAEPASCSSCPTSTSDRTTRPDPTTRTNRPCARTTG